MPKSNLVRDPTKERTERFAANIDKYMRIRTKSNGDVARAAGVSEQVFISAVKTPRCFHFRKCSW